MFLIFYIYCNGITETQNGTDIRFPYGEFHINKGGTRRKVPCKVKIKTMLETYQLSQWEGEVGSNDIIRKRQIIDGIVAPKEGICHPPSFLSKVNPQINSVRVGVGSVLSGQEIPPFPGNCAGFLMDNLNCPGIYTRRTISRQEIIAFLKKCDPVELKDPTAKIVVYFIGDASILDLNERIEAQVHVGLLERNGNILSQWGQYGIFSHPVALVPSEFGENVGFMRMKKSWIERVLQI